MVVGINEIRINTLRIFDDRFGLKNILIIKGVSVIKNIQEIRMEFTLDSTRYP